MFEGRNRCRELIKELQFAYDIMDHNNEVQQIEKQEIIDIQHKQHNKLLQEEFLCEILDSLEGATVCGILDHLSKVRKLTIFLPNHTIYLLLSCLYTF